MKSQKYSVILIICAVLWTAVSCSKSETPNPDPEQDPQTQEDTTSTPVIDPEPVIVPKYYSIPDEFKECEFVAFVSSGSVCKSIVRASGWDAFVDSLVVSKGQTVALVALDRGAEYSVEPVTPGQAAKNYTVKPVTGTSMPAIWSCKVEADSTNAATFSPVLRTFSMEVNLKSMPQDMDSVSFDLRQVESLAPASPGQYSASADNHYSIPVSELGKEMHFLPMLTPSKEIYLVLNFHYRDRWRNCMIHFDKRATARYTVVVNLDLEEKDALDSPELTVSGKDADGNSFKSYQKISLWNHGLTPVAGMAKNYGFKFRSGLNMAFRYGSGFTWVNDNPDKDQDEPWIWPDNDKYIQHYIELGYDHFRIPIDELALVYSDCSPREATIADIKKMVDEAIKGGARVIIDLHWMKTCQYVPSAENEAHYRACWKVLHEHFGEYSTDMLAYEFMNEPNAPDEYWNFFIANSIDMVRQWGGKELNRVLICACNNGQDYSGTDALELPSKTDPNLVLSYHDYFPSNLTFFDAGKAGSIALNYPGRLIKEEDEENYTTEQLESVNGYFLSYYKYSLENLIKCAAQNGMRLGVPVYVGEYGCSQYVPIETRRRWFQDKCDLFRQYNMSFSNWFGLGVAYNDWYYVDQGILDATVVK